MSAPSIVTCMCHAEAAENLGVLTFMSPAEHNWHKECFCGCVVAKYTIDAHSEETHKPDSHAICATCGGFI